MPDISLAAASQAAPASDPRQRVSQPPLDHPTPPTRKASSSPLWNQAQASVLQPERQQPHSPLGLAQRAAFQVHWRTQPLRQPQAAQERWLLAPFPRYLHPKPVPVLQPAQKRTRASLSV